MNGHGAAGQFMGAIVSNRGGIPHSWLAFGLAGTLIGAMVTSSLQSRWGDPLSALFGEFGAVTVLTGVVTVFFLGYRAIVGHLALRNTQLALEHAQRAEIATRFQKGMEMLANSHEATRIGGLYMLRDTIVALPDVYWPSVTDSLFPFIRSSCAELREEYQSFRDLLNSGGDPDEAEAWLDTTPPDVIVALRILGRGWHELRQATESFDLAGRHIRGLVLANVELRDLDFEGVSFQNSIIQGTAFSACRLVECDLQILATQTRFTDCDLSRSTVFQMFIAHGPGDLSFTRCGLQETVVDGTNLTRVSFTQCEIQEENVRHPNVSYY